MFLLVCYNVYVSCCITQRYECHVAENVKFVSYCAIYTIDALYSIILV